MNIRINAIATSVMLATVMPRNRRSILFSILLGKPRSGGTVARRSTLRTVRNTPCTVKLILPKYDAIGIFGAARPLGPESGAISASTFQRRRGGSKSRRRRRRGRKCRDLARIPQGFTFQILAGVTKGAASSQGEAPFFRGGFRHYMVLGPLPLA
jgi:hypothetical protein